MSKNRDISIVWQNYTMCYIYDTLQKNKSNILQETKDIHLKKKTCLPWSGWVMLELGA